MDKKIKECMKTHAIAHLLSGAGLVLILSAIVPVIASNALILGIVVLVVGIGYDLMVNKG